MPLNGGGGKCRRKAGGIGLANNGEAPTERQRRGNNEKAAKQHSKFEKVIF